MQRDGPRGPSSTEAIPPSISAYDDEPETGEPHLHLPVLSVWPVVVAAGITIAGAGLVTNSLVSLAGLIIFSVGIASWIRELRHERHESH